MLARRRPADAALLAGCSLALIAGYSNYAHWEGGVSWGARYLAPVLPLLLLPLGELLPIAGATRAVIAALALAGVLVQVAGTAVDFHRVMHEMGMNRETLFDPEKMPIRVHWHFLRNGKHLDWLPLRIFHAHGTWAALAYLVIPATLLMAGLLGVWVALRGAKLEPARRRTEARLVARVSGG